MALALLREEFAGSSLQKLALVCVVDHSVHVLAISGILYRQELGEGLF